MPAPHKLPVVLAVLACVALDAVVVAADPLPERPATAPFTHDAAAEVPIGFYLAHGEADACGAGCSEWIAAEREIDAKAAQKLRQLLANLTGRELPIVLHSAGGSGYGAIELGRVIHRQKLTVSVGRTAPLGYDRDKPLAELCVAIKRSGHEVKAKLDPTTAMCFSACVFVLAGGDVRLIPSGARIGIHDMWFDLNHPSFALRSEAETGFRRVAYGRLQHYLREVGVDESLLTTAIVVPSNSLKELRREEIVRFGLDRREFDEPAWQFVDKPMLSISKRFFVRTDCKQTDYADGLVRMGCGFDLSMHVVLAR
jgi:hypothetical protein